MKRLPIGIQHFPKLIQNEYLYIDKTQIIWQMLSEGEGYFFSRPRRFGKSLLTSTLKTLFQGKKEFFTELWISNINYHWTSYPVIHLDFSKVYAHSFEMIIESLNQRLIDVANEYGVSLEAASYPAETLIRLIRHLDLGEGVVILIDEYDKPITDHLHERELLVKNREVLKDFFSVIKSQGEFLRFVFVTGVTKFSKISLFSGMNNLIDISLIPTYATLAGITEKEIAHYYVPYLHETSKFCHQTIEETHSLMRAWYNGYRFGRLPSTEKVYNPVSLHLFLTHHQLSNYWFSTGTPSFAIEIIKKIDYPIPILDRGSWIGLELEENKEVETVDLLSLLFQTGYLTIGDFNEASLKYYLQFPNEEVRLSFYHHLFFAFTAIETSRFTPLAEKMTEALSFYNFNVFFSYLNQLLSEIPYPIQIFKEAYYHSLIFLVMRILDFQVEAEVLTSCGRLDLLLTHKDNLFIFEFKINRSAEAALQQIEEKKYGDRFKKSGKKITLIGVNFNTGTRLIDTWKLKNLEP